MGFACTAYGSNRLVGILTALASLCQSLSFGGEDSDFDLVWGTPPLASGYARLILIMGYSLINLWVGSRRGPLLMYNSQYAHMCILLDA